MRVSELMTPSVETILPMDSLQQAATQMRELDVGSLPVCEDGRLKGMITDRDITIRGVADNKPADTGVGEIMTAGVTWCYEDQEIQEAAELMKDKQLRRLPVLDRDRNLVGILAQADLATLSDELLTGEVVEKVSEPAIDN